MNVSSSKFRCAATVILTAPKLFANESVGIGTFLVQRSAESRFMPNSYVFPGGEINDADFNGAWEKPYSELCLGRKFLDKRWLDNKKMLWRRNLPRPPLFDAFRQRRDASDIPPEWAFKVAALRELYEETGIVALYDKEEERTMIVSIGDIPDTKSRNKFVDRQETVRNHPNEFLNLFIDDDQPRYSLAFWLLKEWSNWLTPAFFPDSKRFDTIFYLLFGDAETNFSLCTRELERAEWSDPQSALKKSSTGEMLLPPPQILELSRLAKFSSLNELNTFAEEREKMGLIRWCPQIIHTGDGNRVALLPGDSLYQDSNAEDVKPYSVPESLVSLRESSKYWHRTEFRPTSDHSPWTGWKFLQRNVISPNGHVQPLDSPNI